VYIYIYYSTYIITVCIYIYIYYSYELCLGYVRQQEPGPLISSTSFVPLFCVNFGKKRSGYKIGSASNINHVARKNSTYWEVQGRKNTSSCPININKLFELCDRLSKTCVFGWMESPYTPKKFGGPNYFVYSSAESRNQKNSGSAAKPPKWKVGF